MDKNSTYGLEPEQLARLLSIGIERANSIDEICADKIIAELLLERLSSPLSEDSSLLDLLSGITEQLGCDMQSLTDKSLSSVLLDPKTDIGLLQVIKDYGKKLSCGAASEVESAIAITIYYAAIAGSIVYHDKKISQYSYEALDQSFAALAEKNWIIPELVELFSQARQICQARIEK